MVRAHPLRTALITGLMVGIAWSQWEARAFIEVNIFRRGAAGFLRTGWDILPYHIVPPLAIAILLAVCILSVLAILSAVYSLYDSEYTPKNPHGADWAIALVTPTAILALALLCVYRPVFRSILPVIFASLIGLALLFALALRRIKRPFRWWAPILVMAAVWGLSWINLPPPPDSPPPGDAPKRVADTGYRVLLLAVDAVDWQFLGPGVERGELPEFARLIESGSSGMLHTHAPAVSPIVWTSIATGKVPEKHGIEGWVVFRLKGNGAPFLNFPPNHFLTRLNGPNRRLVNMTPLSSTYRRCRAIWNVVNGPGEKVIQVGWWVTWPAEKVKGVAVSPYGWPFVDTVMIHENLPQTHPPGSAYPASIMERLKPLITTAADLDGKEFMGLSPEIRRQLEEQSKVYDLWYHAKDISFIRMFDLLLTDHPDYTFATVYIEGIDITQHVFLRYSKPEWFPPHQRPKAIEEQTLGFVIPMYYKWVDGQIAQLLERHADDHTVVVVVSDHGTEARFRNVHYSGDHVSSPPGVIILAGGPIKQGVTINSARVEDVTPTLLYILGYPVGEDMDGEVLTEIIEPAFLERYPIRKIPTLDTGFEWSGSANDTTYDKNLIEKLKDIGYL